MMMEKFNLSQSKVPDMDTIILFYFGFEFKRLPSLHIINDDCTLTISDQGQIKSLSNKIVSGPTESAHC